MASLINKDSMEFECPKHQLSLLASLKDMYDTNTLTDVCIAVEQHKFECHRNVLAGSSPYFKAMFTNDLQERYKQTIEIFDIDSTSMELIINFAYTGNVEITMTNAQSLMAASSLFQMTSIVNACAKYMETQLDVSNCIPMHYLAAIHNCNELASKAKEHIEKNFNEVTECEEFLQLSVEKLSEIISSSDLNVDSEEIIFESIVDWINHDKNQREEYMKKLLPHDPACVVTPDNQIFIAGGNYVYHDSWYWDDASDVDSLDEYDGEDTVRRDLCCYDNDHDTWIAKSPMLFPKSNFALVHLDGFLYCFGGLTVNQHPTEIIEKYDIESNRWTYVGMMPTTLVDLSAVVHDGMIYVLGGRTGVGAHNVLMKYDSIKSEWTTLAGIPTPRFSFGACVVGSEIYVAGGQIYSHTSNTIHRDSLSSVEIYNITENIWRQGPELPSSVYNVGLIHVNGSLFACGTVEVQRNAFRVYGNVVYKLDLGKSTWRMIEDDLCDIRDFACVSARFHTRKLAQVFRPEVDT
ncbi:unnamed protein product [Owenia fusiformis]|uniref:BTB domain-containing protein n=1 Tax=Owenia fusiformis TaxID=6347 RepID=A0A8S4PAG3_OWEFU|nr:unnamed protein product [Owenia fusiformis]